MQTPPARPLVALIVVCSMLAALGACRAPAGLTITPTEPGFTPLFNGNDLSGWYSWIDGLGRDTDPEGYFEIADDGSLHILGLPPSTDVKPYGFLATDREYSDFHLRLEYRWGTEKFAPRLTALRDSGLLYHVTGPDVIWPTSAESQVQEGDTGDIIMLGGALAGTELAPGTTRYEPGGERTARRFVEARTVADTLTGWNTVEVIVRGDSAVHIVNGAVVNRSFNLTFNGRRLDRGRILLQAEGAEIFYRNIEIRELSSSPAVLVYSMTTGYRHASIPVAVEAIRSLGATEGFQVDATEDPAAFTDTGLAPYSAVVFVSTTGEVLPPARRPALEQFIRSGRGYAGVHAASDGGDDWPWYGELVGSYFQRHPHIQEALLQVETNRHPSTAHLDSTWTRTDEWYDFTTNPRPEVTVLLDLDESSYEGGEMGDHPISWYRRFDGGRSWYTGGGHTSASFAEPDFLAHLLGGIQYAGAFAAKLPGTPLDRTGWQATASHAGEHPSRAFDGDLTTRYTTGSSQSSGMYLDIDLGERRRFDAIVLDLFEEYFDEPRGYEVLVSDSPSFSDPAIAVGQGTSPRTTIRFEPARARYVRIRQTGEDNTRWWSICELHVIETAVRAIDDPAIVNAPAERLSG